MVITPEMWPQRGRISGARTVQDSELTDEQRYLIRDLFVEEETDGRPRISMFSIHTHPG